MALNIGRLDPLNPLGGSLNISTRASGVTTLGELDDVQLGLPGVPLGNGQVLQYDGSIFKWVNIVPPWKEVTAGDSISVSTVVPGTAKVSVKTFPNSGIVVTSANGIQVDPTAVIMKSNSAVSPQVIDGNLTITGALTVGAGSSIDASTLNGHAGSYYLNSANFTGTMLAAQAPAFTGGDVTSTAGSLILTLANVGSPGTKGSSSQIPVFTVDAKGRVTGNINTPIIAADQSTAGIVRLATSTETTTGTSTTLAVSPSGLASALALKANLVSPAFTGTPTAPTAATTSNSTQLATTAFVKSTSVQLTGSTMSGNLILNNSSPTVTYQNTGNMSAFTHCASNRFYILRGAVNSTTWTQVNGQWPLYIDLSTNDATFGRNIYAVGDVSAYSDIKLKTNINVIPDALDKVNTLRGVTYDRIDNGERNTGLIAQEVQSVLPEAVSVGPDNETLCVAYGNIAGLLVEAIKELTAASKKQAKLIEEQQKIINELMQRGAQ